MFRLIIALSIALCLSARLLKAEAFCPETQAYTSAMIAALQAIPEVSIDFVPVDGATAEEVRSSLNARGPTGIDNRRYDAYTFWEVYWRWPARKGQPEFEKIKMTCKARVTLPCWIPSKEAQFSVIQRWRHFLERMVVHELGHVDNMRRHCAEVSQTILQLARADSGLSAEEANQAGQAIIEEIRAQDLRYDKETRSGAGQGAVFP